jgi:TolA-binding protein
MRPEQASKPDANFSICEVNDMTIDRTICRKSATVLMVAALAGFIAAGQNSRAEEAAAPETGSKPSGSAASSSTKAADPVAKELEVMKERFEAMKQGFEAMQARIEQLEAELKSKTVPEQQTTAAAQAPATGLLATTTKDPSEIPILPGTLAKPDLTKTVATTAAPQS